ncbi:MAG TPA: alpha/beta fold hydrolase [Actinomycetota bacterium]|nr:alpha/beta fold hydrolase [Actinomycetota bacterium]
MTEVLRIDSSDGLSLEAAIDAPDDPRSVLVLCHPHPKMGGTMNAPLLIALADYLVHRGWAVVRFNFRGIGASEGEAGTGIEEVADAAGALQEARRRYDTPVAIGGWSFGGAVAIRAATEAPDLAACVGIAPAVREKPGITAGLPAPEDVHLTCPLGIVCGSNDDLVRPEDCRAWAEAAGATYVEIRAANHFFWAKYDALTDAVADFLDATLV